MIFQRLTGQRVVVSNYPGTTVEVARGTARALPGFTLIDTPGVIAFPPYSEDEQVTARLLVNEPIQAILQVGDAKNLRRTLLLTLQLAEMGLPLVLALNMMDEAQARGVALDYQQLSQAIEAAGRADHGHQRAGRQSSNRSCALGRTLQISPGIPARDRDRAGSLRVASRCRR